MRSETSTVDSAVDTPTAEVFVLAGADRSRATRFLFVWVAILVFLFVQSELASPERNVLAVEAVVIFAFGVYCLSRSMAAGFWSPAALFLLVLAIFHISLVVHMLTGVDPELPRLADYAWFDGPAGAAALHLTSIGMAAYTAAALLRVALHHDRVRVARDDDDRLAARFAGIGAFVLLVGVLGWFWIASSTVGFGGITGSYQSFLAATQATDIHLTYPLIAVGLGLAVMTPLRALQKVALVLFAVFAVFGFFLGLRGEVLFPLAVAVSIMATRRKMPNFALVAIGGLLLLTLINAAKQIRQAGLGESGFSLQDATPLAALSELGQTMRVVATVVNWHEFGGEPFRGGDTYTVAVSRLAEQLFLSERPSAATDFRLFNVEISTRAGNIGGSMIGEAYHNLDVGGVALVLALAGLLFASFSLGRRSPLELALYVVIAVPLYNHIRNSFVPVIPSIAVGVILVLVIYATRRMTVSRSRAGARA
ncbi:O-antigen polysaccharide polymerase Wzy [Microbacterium paraoxydans]|uniref:O-antigen polysaccharide polymerase Wzy n=1 Tax=Microbacterium paraoxydans TaxID=199592 RepID=UPI001CF9D1D5|nr:O-antigen polysaccharide polymerase Wzy [Microbacterium paraoxydans]